MTSRCSTRQVQALGRSLLETEAEFMCSAKMAQEREEQHAGEWEAQSMVLEAATVEMSSLREQV
jgi:hypothetical protein